MIFVWGVPTDRQIVVVRNCLQRIEAPCFFFDQRKTLGAEIEMSVKDRVSGTLRIGNATLDLGSITAAYLRPYDSGRIPAVARAGVNSAEYKRARAVEDALLAWSEVTSALVVNRPSDMAPNGSKPFQAMLIKQFGFKVPQTLITTSPEDVLAFQREHESIIYKSISGIRSIVSRLSPERSPRLAYVRFCPTQFQQYVAGEDYRVHVVGERLFVSRIVSTACDYRYAGRQEGETHLWPAELPPDVAARCKTMARAMHLVVAGIDLRLTPKGDWYCFEVNPSPGFTYFADACELPIDEELARLLANGRGQELRATQRF